MREHHQGEHRSRGRLLLILLVVVAVYGLTLLGIHLAGTKLEGGAQEESYGSLEGRFEPPLTLEWQEKTYTYPRNRLTNLLVIGIDKEDMADLRTSGRSGGQADFMLLLSIDKKERTVTPIHLDRDTMTPVQIYGTFGNPAGTRTMQLCLSYAFGDGAAGGCANTMDAVSELLGNIPVDYCLALDMDGIAAMNDLLGGVRVTLKDDFSHLDPSMTRGTTLTLTGQQAEYYVRSRMTVADGTNRARMERQRCFMEEAARLLYGRMAQDAQYFNTFLRAMNNHLYMNMSDDWLASLAYTCRDYTLQDIQTLAGTHSLGEDGFVEFHFDDDALKALITNTFFE